MNVSIKIMKFKFIARDYRKEASLVFWREILF